MTIQPSPLMTPPLGGNPIITCGPSEAIGGRMAIQPSPPPCQFFPYQIFWALNFLLLSCPSIISKIQESGIMVYLAVFGGIFYTYSQDRSNCHITLLFKIVIYFYGFTGLLDRVWLKNQLAKIPQVILYFFTPLLFFYLTVH